MPKSFRILMVTPTSFFSDYGGHIRILEETRILQELGHQVAIVTYYKGSDMPGLDIRRTPPLPWRVEYEVGSSRHKFAFDLYLAGQSLVEGLRFRPDVIHGHMHEGALIGGVLSRLLRVPLVFDFQGSLTAEMVDHHFLRRDGRLHALFHRVEKFINRRLSHAILTSSLQAADLLRQEFGVPDQHIHPLPDCADPVRFNPQNFTADQQTQLRQKWGIPPDTPIIAYLGLLTDYQGLPHLIQSARLIKEAGESAHFLIMGYPNVEHYQQMAQAQGVADCITFTNKIEYRYAPLYLSLGDIAVAPKLSSTEGSGKLLNYMAMGQPIVAYETAVHREYLADLGIYAPVGDVHAFSQAIIHLLHQSTAERQALGQKLRQRAIQEYSWRQAGERIVALYEHLTA